MLNAFSGGDVRSAEAPLIDAGQGNALMQKAAHGLFGVVLGLLRADGRGIYGATAVVLAGSGNNGADALYAGERLLRRGVGATAILTSDRVHAASLEAFVRAGGTTVRLDDADPSELAAHAAAADVLIDGILGTGASGGLRGASADFAEAFDTAAGPRGTRSTIVVACDLPSGIGTDSGLVEGPVLHADATVTFGAAKPGLLIGEGAVAAGELNVVDIGLDFSPFVPVARSLLSADAAALLRPPRAEDHKYSRGVLGVAAGSARYPGAAALAVGAALATGVGMVRYLGPDAVAALIHQRNPEAVASTGSVADARSQAWLVGPGAVDDDDQRRRAVDAMASGLPTIVDAGALGAVPERVGPQVILTPHAGELRQLLAERGLDAERSEIEAEPAHFALRAAETTGATVLLKGFTTVVAAPSGALFVQADATPWLATAGSGDTLSGIVGALAATLAEDDGAAGRIGVAQEDLWAAVAAAGALIHGSAGRRAALRGPVVVSDLPADIGGVVADLLEERRLTM
ncbi:bifunctional ADP-dependent NAD(P)H-hydrate dehydratase/NAD(P)H-hydrate epimerase [Arthrobacter sedimenti]|uniref:bifunctional ADP-dependent NAD(P)H-hydrate dehydratase/NAD(P)H-hydrate epimerase n=1 Tax=Arthrobacter sedimenti TaxID=2694931 RepID=UPI000B350967|nr:bifunctional ADP-dependent NAD(P)H-hydrate dehydratase/NAD(P)H-hydrate epimerase [Arthrobacter sedimenti]OUM40013.1 bifunctional ADP-dependent NAD(P)H-hydrate dehydratase/NAD(P)H-hydrate epimerase [Arthrobacter agilis]